MSSCKRKGGSLRNEGMNEKEFNSNKWEAMMKKEKITKQQKI